MSPPEHTDRPLVSVNVCCYNSERHLEATIDSVLAQTYQHWELVIINDGSRDGTERIVQSYLAREPRIVYHAQPNAGLGTSRNTALRLSRGRYIALLDHDDVWLPEKLEAQVDGLERQPGAAVSFTDAHAIDAEGGVLWLYSVRTPPATSAVLAQIFLSNFVLLSSILIRRSVLDEVGEFDTQLTISEEYDLLLRIAERYSFEYVPAPLTRWRLHASNFSWNLPIAIEEQALVLRRALARNPRLEETVGSRVVRLRLAGFACTRGQACLLRGDLAGVRAAYGGVGPAVAASGVAGMKYAVALLPGRLRHQVMRALNASRRRSLLRSPKA